MPRFNDAIGYLLELRTSINQAWFHSVCDKAIASIGQGTTEDELNLLWDLFNGSQTYSAIAANPPPITIANSTTNTSPISLSRISGFNGFKKLSSALDLQLNRQVTLVFGRNGSGKSSLCQALKLLSISEVPDTPIRNIHNQSTTTTPSFQYRTPRVATDVTWTEASGYGVERNLIKYFDSSIAIKHVTGSINTEAVVEVVVFRLEIFGYARAIAQAFQTYAYNRISTEKSQLTNEINHIKSVLAPSIDITIEPYLNWSPVNSQNILNHIAGFIEFTPEHQNQLASHRMALLHMEPLVTEEGYRAAISEELLLTQLKSKINEIKNFAVLARVGEVQQLTTLLLQKKAAQIELSRQFFPANVDAGIQRSLVIASASMLDLSAVMIGTSKCPLCAQSLDANATHLFHQYHTYLHSTLHQEATVLEQELSVIRSNLTLVKNFQLGDFNACIPILPRNYLEALNEFITELKRVTPFEGYEINAETIAIYDRIPELDQYLSALETLLSSISESLRLIRANRLAFDADILSRKVIVKTLEAHEAIWNNKTALEDICNRCIQKNSTWQMLELHNFTGLYSALTRKNREAHTELVREAFEQRLSSEYQQLCGATLQQMGVSLKSVGEQQEIIVSPQVGNFEVHRVFSEGEQKIHALAVFFCEATVTPHQVLVFDDPVTSFDYNNISNFAERLRTLIRSQPNTQIIILTHNWDFFINLQATMNRSRLDTRLSVQILEDCATVKEYVESWDVICTSIDSILNLQAEPTQEQKEKVSGEMRRLIERLTNQFVFYDQRHQYKAKALPASDFHNFMKIVPLLLSEADELRDLYANLSPPEHDDLRNFYATKTKLQFITWYTSIKNIAAALLARRPI